MALPDPDLPRSCPDEMVSRALAFIAARAHELRLTRVLVAREIGVSSSLLSHRFKLSSGVGIREAIATARVERAAGMLALGPGKPIKAIAVEVGFTNEKLFAYWFRRLRGVTPTDWRERCQRRPRI